MTKSAPSAALTFAQAHLSELAAEVQGQAPAAGTPSKLEMLAQLCAQESGTTEPLAAAQQLVTQEALWACACLAEPVTAPAIRAKAFSDAAVWFLTVDPEGERYYPAYQLNAMADGRLDPCLLQQPN